MEKKIIIVSGLPRSGTSMMMAMLQAGGLPLLTDKVRKANEDNPKGYFELEKVKEIEKDKSWLEKTEGKGVKVVSSLLQFLPQNYDYQVIFMLRQMDEVLASQRQMMERRKSKDSVDDKKMAVLFNKHLSEIKIWLKKQPNVDILYVSYSETIKNPAKAARKVNQFLGGALDEKKMMAVVDKKLYRQREG